MKTSSDVSHSSRASQGRLTADDRRGRLKQQLRSDRCEVDVVHIEAVRNALNALPNAESLGQVAELLAILASPTRLTMLLALQPESEAKPAELCVCDLATVTGASKSLTSHQLRLLRAAGLVRQRRAGKLSFYRLSDGPLISLLIDLARMARDSERNATEWSAQALANGSPAAIRPRGAHQA